MESEFHNMRREMDELRNVVKDRVVDNLDEIIQRMDSPFTTEVLNHPLRPKFHLPQVELFDGSRDPLDHIESFKTLILLQMTPNEVMCRAFPTTLKGAQPGCSLPSYPLVLLPTSSNLARALFDTSLEDNDKRSQRDIFSTSTKQWQNR